MALAHSCPTAVIGRSLNLLGGGVMCRDLFDGSRLWEEKRAITTAFLEDMEHYGPLRAEQERGRLLVLSTR